MASDLQPGGFCAPSTRGENRFSVPKPSPDIKEAPGYRTCEWAVRSSSQRVHKPVAWDYSPNPCPVEAADLPERSHSGNKVRPHAPFSQSPVPGTGFSQPAGQQLRELEKLVRKITAKKWEERVGKGRESHARGSSKLFARVTM